MNILYTRRVKEHKEDFYPFHKPVKCQHQSNVVNYTRLIPTATKKKKAIQRNTHKSITDKEACFHHLAKEYDDLSF